ncbi:MAG TPA: VWA domain-containing protein [Thermoanaerobaculia bacterium]|nr:VWA domain-containing protein [Thermoanaerobaculia bacterium]
MGPRRSQAALAAAALLGLAISFVLLAAPLPAQEEGDEGWQPIESFGETVSVELVNVEVWVVDRRGNPVTGLSREDFELFEDGERRDITHFAAFEPTGAPAGAGEERRVEAGAPIRIEVEEGSSQWQAVNEDSRLHLAVFVDNWNLAPGDRARVFQDLRDFLGTRVEPDDRVMVAIHDRALQVVQELTADPEELTSSLDRVERLGAGLIHVHNARRSALVDIREAHANAPNLGGTGDPCLEAWGEMENAARSYAVTLQSHAQRSGGALASVSQYLAGVPGRKVLLYVGSGLPQQAGVEVFQFLAELCPHQQSQVATYSSQYDLTWLYQEVVRQANAHGITFYMLEAAAPVASEDLSFGGLSGPSQPAGGAGGEGGGGEAGGPGGVVTPSSLGRPGEAISTGGQTYRPSAAARRLAEQDLESPLVILASETGGKAILNAADFRADFDRLATDLRTYYSLGFTPPHQGDGELHRLKVNVKGEGYRVRHRSAYHDKPYEQRMAERIAGTAQFGTGENGLRIRVETGEATPVPGGGHRVPVRIWVPLDAITLVPGEEGLRGRLRVLMAVSDRAGNLGPVRQKTVPVEIGALDEDRPARAVQTGHPGEKLVEVDLDLAGAEHVVSLGVRDELGGETSYVRHKVRLGATPQARVEP